MQFYNNKGGTILKVLNKFLLKFNDEDIESVCLFLIPGFLNLVDYPKMPENYRDFVEFKAKMEYKFINHDLLNRTFNL